MLITLDTCLLYMADKMSSDSDDKNNADKTPFRKEVVVHYSS